MMYIDYLSAYSMNHVLYDLFRKLITLFKSGIA
jgi:hypothetical protein